MDLGDSFLPKIALFIALLSIYEALMLIHYRAHVSFLCQHIRCVCVFLFLSLWLHRHLCEECYVKLPFCRFFSLLLCGEASHRLTVLAGGAIQVDKTLFCSLAASHPITKMSRCCLTSVIVLVTFSIHSMASLLKNEQSIKYI